MSEKKIIAVAGSTGAQGGGLVRAILDDPENEFSVRALTRDPESGKARALAARGAAVVKVDFGDESSVTDAFGGAWGAYCVTFFWDHMSPQKEKDQALAMARAAKAAGIQHAIWSTLPDSRDRYPLDDDRMPGIGEYKIPHVDAKSEANRFFTDLGVPTTFLHATFYYENFIYFGMEPHRNAGNVLSINLPLGKGKLPCIGSEDIGKSALALFKKGPEMTGRTVGVMGDHLTGEELAAIMSDAFGETVVYEPVTTKEYASFGFPGARELANQFQYFDEGTEMFAQEFSIADTRSLNPALQDFTSWLKANRSRVPSH